MKTSIKYIRDRFGLGDQLKRGIQAIGAEEQKICKRNHIPTFRGVLYEKDELGNLIFKNSNTVVLGGSITALEKLCGVEAAYRTPTFNSLMNYHPMGDPQTPEEDWADEPNSFLSLFAVGTGGAPDSFGIVYAPDFKQTNISSIIPFRVNTSPTLDAPGLLPGEDNKLERAKYTARMQDGSNYYWYLKKFEKPVEIRSLWKNAPDLTKDGTEILSDADVSSGPDGTGIESFAECTIRIDPDDIRPYFEANGNIDMARFNTLALFTGREHVITDEYSDYTNIRLFSVVNFDNESVKIAKETTYVYRIYSSL